MSGHSKWATTKRKKAKTDVARAKAWNKLLLSSAVETLTLIRVSVLLFLSPRARAFRPRISKAQSPRVRVPTPVPK